MSTDSKKERVLIIEGNAKLSEQMSHALKAEGYKVTTTKDGDEGLNMLYDVKPDIVILDLAISGKKTAYDILAEKSTENSIKNVPLFALSTQGEPINMRKVPEKTVTDFIISLEPDPADIVNRVNDHFGYKTEPEETTSSGSKKNVLWVEDDKLIGSILGKKFTSSDFNLYHANDGQEALDYIKSNKPDIIILDIMLPGMDGFDILQKIRMNVDLKKVPVMILSNLSKPGDFEKAQMLGASKYLVKASSSLDQIILEVRNLLNFFKKK